MKILYICNFVDKNYFNDIFNKALEKPIQSIQKFNELFVEGLRKNKDVESINILSHAPVNRKISKKCFWKGKSLEDGNVKYSYIPFINIKILKQICLFIMSIFYVLFWNVKYINKNRTIVVDGFVPVISTVAVIIGKIFNIRIISLYTDIVKFDANDTFVKKNFVRNFIKKVINIGDVINLKFTDMFILLTLQMNEIINKNNKPFIVIEGFVDSKFNPQKNVEKKKAIMYAGGLYEKYGVKLLIDSFIEWNNSEYELWLCGGNGDLIDYINSLNYKNIVYYGALPNDKIVEMEQASTLLVNPRFSNEEYTKYSFPSKNMEYMTSGTPVLTTKLPGMKKEYYDYVYLIEEETKNGFISKFKEITKKTTKELQAFGKKSQAFVLKEKNNIIQAKKIIDKIKKVKIKKRTAKDKLVFFYIAVSIIFLFLSMANVYGLYKVSLKTYFIYIVSIIFLILGLKIKLKEKQINKKDKKSIIDVTIKMFDSEIFRIIILCCMFIIMGYFLKYLFIIKDLPASEIRMAAFDKLYSNAYDAVFYLYVVNNINVLFTILIPLLIFDNSLKHKHIKFNLCVMIISFILFSLIGFGRLNFLNIILAFLFVGLYFVKFENIFKKKNLLYFIAGILLIFIVSMLFIYIRVFSSNQSNGLFSLINYQTKQIFEYFLGSFRALDVFISNGFNGISRYSFGRATFAGIDEIVLYPIKFFGGEVLSFNQIVSPLTQEGIAVGYNTPYYNAFYTSIMNYYLDFGFLGVCLFSYLHGLFINYIFKLYNNRETIISKVLIVLVSINLFMGILKWNYQAGNMTFLIILMILFENFSILKERKIK
ncbi:MAG: oligosaccharide repeat unit polymerase [Bacilli bacterium]|nr:oligosaccharide repeat unit polymerase [Bacilli bacterium]